MKTKENEYQEQLRQFIKSLERIHKDGGGLICVEATFGIRDIHPGDVEYDEKTAGFFHMKKHDGNISIRLELFKPNK